jgi:transposase-like protein
LKNKVYETLSSLEDEVCKFLVGINPQTIRSVCARNWCEFNRKRLRTSNRIERLNQSVKQRTKVAKIFANEDSCLRLVSAVVVAISEQWQRFKASLSLDSD